MRGLLRRAMPLSTGGAVRRVFGGWHGGTGTARLASSAAVSQDDLYDVVVVGGGMVGSALAALLATSKLTSALKVAVVDIREPQMVDGGSLPDVPGKRVSSLSPASAALFRQAGAWEAIAPPRSSQFDAMQVWDSAGSGFVRYEAAEVGADALGWVVENDLMQGALVARLHASDNTELMWPASVTGVRLPGGGGAGAAGAVAVPARVAGTAQAAGGNWAAVELQGGRTLHTRLLVGADGGRSRVREMVGLRTVGLQYGQRGVVATVKMAPGGEGHTTAWQRFLPNGPLALLPVRGGYSNIVWSTTPTEAKRLEALPSEELADEVNRALVGSHAPSPSSQLSSLPFSLPPGLAPPAPPFQEPPRVESISTPAQSFPLSLSHTGKYVLPRLALIGDAAHTVHPLAGQGVNLGFADAAALAEVIKDGVATGRDVGSAELLEEYESRQQRANLMMMAGLHGIQRLFGAKAPPFALARNLGLDVVNRSGPLKTSIVRYAMLGEVPGIAEARA